MEVGSERDLAKMVADHIRNADEPLDAITDATVAAIEAWKLNDEAAIDTAMRSALDRIAASAALVLTTSGLEQP